MALPKLNTIEYFTTLPVSGEEVKYRPFTVGEQKVLLQALEADEVKTIANTVINLVDSCCSLQESKYTVRELSNTDLEYLFLQVRIKSVGEVTKIVLGCENQPTCEATTQVDVDLSSIEVIGKQAEDNKVMITDNVGVTLQVPSFQEVQGLIENNMELKTQDIFNILSHCIDTIFDQDDVHQRSDFSEAELMNFIDELSIEQFNVVMKWFDDLPKLVKDVEYNCSKCNHQNTVRLEGIQNFFA